jgi:hypothetical protein
MMKKPGLILFISMSVIAVCNAQNVDDALRYSQIFYSGTARFNSMGGAFTALGGDVSTFSQNPAGIGILRSSELIITPQMYHFKSDANFNGSSSQDYLYNFNLGQAGLVINILKHDQEKGLITLNFGYSFNKTNNFNQVINIEGTSNNSSFLDYFVEKSNGYYKDELSDKVPDAFLAWDTWLIDTLPDISTLYGTVYSNYGDDPPSVYGQHMRHIITTDGFTGEHAISFGGNYSNKLFFGLTFGINQLNYESKFEHLESTDAELSSKFTDFNYMFYYRNTGVGYSLKFGTIFKPIETLRIGLAFHAPTIYYIDEEVNDNMTSYFSDRVEPYKSYNNTSVYNYSLTTPFRLETGVAIQVKKIALLSADYEFVDYGTAKFSETGDGYDYTGKNREINNTLQAVNNLRLGAEIRLENLYFRGGYGYYGKAFENDELNSDLDYNSYSVGIGFREQNIYGDLGYTYMSNSRKYIVYDSSIETVISDMDLHRNIISVTFGYKFGF